MAKVEKAGRRAAHGARMGKEKVLELEGVSFSYAGKSQKALGKIGRAHV